MRAEIPHQGDLITLSFDPRSGHWQGGHRPALVLSKTAFNRMTGFAIVCAITNTARRFPFHVPLPAEGPLTGIIVEHAKSIDYRARAAKRIGRAPDDLLEECLAKLDTCLY